MTTYQLLPNLTADEYHALHDDIEAHGIRVPVDVDEDGNVLDGHHRRAIAVALDIDYPTRLVAGLSEQEKRDHALAVNVQRRSLTREQKRELIAASLKADPELSDRQHGERTGVDHKTVGARRGELESSGEIPQSDGRRSADGRERPASQPPRPQRDTGEPEGEPSPDPVAAAVAEFPDLEYFAQTGQRDRVLKVAGALRGYPEPERSRRIETLKKSVAAAKTQDAEPNHEQTQNVEVANEMFIACNTAAQVVDKLGGPEVVRAAVRDTDAMTTSLWRGQFADLANICRELEAACGTKLRSIK